MDCALMAPSFKRLNHTYRHTVHAHAAARVVRRGLDTVMHAPVAHASMIHSPIVHTAMVHTSMIHIMMSHVHTVRRVSRTVHDHVMIMRHLE